MRACTRVVVFFGLLDVLVERKGYRLGVGLGDVELNKLSVSVFILDEYG